MKVVNRMKYYLLLAALAAPFGACQEEPSYALVDAQKVEGLFAVKPGTEAWRKFQNHGEMVASAQLPDATIKGMSTQELLDACLSYPLLGDMMAYNSPRQGFQAVVGQFNGFKELLARADVGTVALDKYRSVDAMAVSADPENAALPNFVTTLAAFEHILAQPRVIDSLTPAQKQILIAETTRKLHQKLEEGNAESYGGLSLEATSLVAARVLAQVPTTEFSSALRDREDLSHFVAGDLAVSPHLVELILKQGDLASSIPVSLTLEKREEAP